MKSDEEILWLSNENTYIDPNDNNKIKPFPSPSSPPSVDLSFVAPAYNEEERLIPFMESTLTYLKQRKKNNPSFTYEILIVDDGSSDKTSEVALKYVKQETIDNIRLLKLQKNRGKGGALKRVCVCVSVSVMGDDISFLFLLRSPNT